MIFRSAAPAVLIALAVNRRPGSTVATIFLPLFASLLIPFLVVRMNKADGDGFEVGAFELANFVTGGLFAVLALSFTIHSGCPAIAATDNTVPRLVGLKYMSLAFALLPVIVFHRCRLPGQWFGRAPAGAGVPVRPPGVPAAPPLHRLRVPARRALAGALALLACFPAAAAAQSLFLPWHEALKRAEEPAARTGEVDYRVLPVHRAALAGDVAGIRAALERGEAVNANAFPPGGPGYEITPLHFAASAGRTAAVRLLLARGAAPCPRTPVLGLAPIHLAAEAGDEPVLDLLLRTGLSPDEPTRGDPAFRGGFARGLTALHLAASSGRPGAVRRLLDAGADPLAASLDGDTPLDLAVRDAYRGSGRERGFRDHAEALALLLEAAPLRADRVRARLAALPETTPLPLRFAYEERLARLDPAYVRPSGEFKIRPGEGASLRGLFGGAVGASVRGVPPGNAAGGAVAGVRGEFIGRFTKRRRTGEVSLPKPARE